MSNQYIFEPERRWGVVFQAAAIIVLLIASGWGIWRAARAEIGLVFLLYTMPALISVFLVPLLVYRLYSLLGAYYHIERDGMRLRWGLRIEDIPMGSVLWIAQAAELEQRVPLPWVLWPGSVVGLRHLPDGSHVEFMANGLRDLIVVATQKQYYAISPHQPDRFLETFRRLMEVGSLSPIAARSIYPSFLLARVWRMKSARNLLLAGFALNLALLVGVSLEIPTINSVYLGFATASEPVPAVRLLLLPILSGAFFLVDAFLGMFFYRGAVEPPAMESDIPRQIDINIDPARLSISGSRMPNLWLTKLNEMLAELRKGMSLVPGNYLAYLLWWSGAITPALFILAIFFMIRFAG